MHYPMVSKKIEPPIENFTGHQTAFYYKTGFLSLKRERVSSCGNDGNPGRESVPGACRLCDGARTMLGRILYAGISVLFPVDPGS